jgi:DNA-binding beta-propeller fold protein YncE
VDANNNVYVADSGNNKIRKISPTGEVTTLAGSGVEGAMDGSGIEANFKYPEGVAVDSNGKVYVADGYNNKIRKISPE